MSIAVSEILKQVEGLSVDEQMELTTRLLEQVRQPIDPGIQNGQQAETDDEMSLRPEGESLEGDEGEEGLDAFSLNHVPPKRTYTAYARFYYAGRGKPLPYDFDGLFDDEDESEAELRGDL